jgi:dTDP-glucose pyrophosphorylase
VLDHIIEGLRDEAGIRDIFIVTGWQGQVIRDHFGDGTKWGVRLVFGEQKVQDGTGRAADPAKEWIGGESFLLVYGDMFPRVPADYARLVAAFREDGVIALKAGEDLTKGGAVVLDEAGFMTQLMEKARREDIPPNAYYNAAIYLLPARIFDFTARLEKSPRGEYEFTDALKAFVQAGARLRGVVLSDGWADVRDPGVLAELNERRT